MESTDRKNMNSALPSGETQGKKHRRARTNSVRNLISFENSLQASYESFDLKEARIFTDVAKMYFDFSSVTGKTLSDYAYRMGDCSIYYYTNKGHRQRSGERDISDRRGSGADRRLRHPG